MVINMKGSIYKKIRRQMMLGAFASAAAVFLAAAVCIAFMRVNIIGASRELGRSAAEDSKAALEVQMQESLYQLARNKAVISDEKLAEVAKLVTLITKNAEAVVSQSGAETYPPRAVAFPDAANAGRSVAQLRLAEEVDYPEVEDEIGLLGNLSGLLVSGEESLEYVRSVYIGSENGVSISADVDSDKKTNVYDPRSRGWYQSAKSGGGLIWTDVFADNSGRGLAITCAMPFFGADGSLFGVVGAGMQLEVLTDIVVEAKLGETGYAFIVNEHGEIIISDSVTVNEEGNIISQSLSDLLPAETTARMIDGGDGIERVMADGRDCFIAYAPLTTLPWSLAVVMSVEEVIASAIESEDRIIAMTGETVTGNDRNILIALGVFAAALVLTLAGNAILARRLAAGLAKPVIELSNGAAVIGAGNLEHRLDVRTGDELEALADAFNAMIEGIKRVTAEKERIGAELDVATKIQASMLPSIFPPFPERAEFDIYASMQPAKEVGGDFYDFFLVDENTLAVVMADVSGKGVPAALFMVIAKTLIKNNAQYGKSPKEVFETVNNLLCEGNEAGMFVTAFMGYLDIKSGKFTFVNAGHNPPLLRTLSAGGKFDWLKTKPGFVLAGMEGMPYKQHEIFLNPGDGLFLYTDGVTEAVNNENKLFSDPRLLETANGNLDLPLREFTVSIKSEIDKFAEGAEQADDITMMILKYKGGNTE